MTTGLSHLLGAFLKIFGRQLLLVPLADEVFFLESYLELQAMRFGEWLKVTLDIPLEFLRRVFVPQLSGAAGGETRSQMGSGSLSKAGEIRAGKWI